MILGRFAVLAGFVSAMICLAVAAPVDAAPAPSARTLVASVGIEQVRCNCVRHLHRRTYVRRYVPEYGTPLYPAPPVGVTFRKLFDAGYL